MEAEEMTQAQETTEELSERMAAEARTSREVTVELCTPIKIDGIDRQTLKLRRPTVDDYMQLEKQSGTGAEKDLWFIGRLANVNNKELTALDVADYEVLAAVATGFRGGRPSR